MNRLNCDELTKSYGNKKVLDGITLTLEPHKIYGLIGRNGAGKTTLLGILSGQNKADSGRVELDGERVFDCQASLDRLCFARELSSLTLFGKDSRKVKTVLNAAALMFPFWDKEYAARLVSEFELDTKKRISGLSKGMLSAVTIIIGLASKAPVTFLDEPVAGLDVFMRDRFYRLLLEEYTETERTFVVSTHIIDEAANVLEDVIIIESGKILRCENTEELLSTHRIVSGLCDDVDDFLAKSGYKVTHTESRGRSKTVCVEFNDAAEFKSLTAGYDFDISKASLQKLFMNLLG